MKALVNSVLGRAGLEIRRLPHLNQQTAAGRRFSMLQYNRINKIIDVGANSGQYARYIRESGYQGAIFSFEPLDGPFSVLQAAAAKDPNWKAFHFALGAESDRLPINVSKNTYSSSFLQVMDRSIEAASGSAFTGTQEAEIKRLDALDLGITGEDRILLKIDAQGFEDKVLVGATGVLPRVFLIECELSTVPLYEEQTLFVEMIKLLESLGFKPVDFEQEFIEPKTGYCLQVNGMFTRT
jgi:FkbM family methyltransferase